MNRFRTPARVALAVLTLMAAVAAFGGGADAARRPSTYHVTVYNTMEANYLTPPNWAGHTPVVDVFEFRQAASSGIQGLAENGDVMGLAAELSAAIDDEGLGVSGYSADGPIGPGGSSEWYFSTTRGRFSLAAMVICTNDGFGGLDSRGLPTEVGETKTFNLRAYDAGTEINTEMRQDFVGAPFCGEGEGTGETNPELAENGVIRLHKGIRGVGDIDTALDWDGPVGHVVITRVD